LFSVSVIDPGLIEAYRQTHYKVTEVSPITLRIAAHSTELAALHEAKGVSSSAFITAFNPFSRSLKAAENEARHQRLLAWTAGRRMSSLAGIGQHPTDPWPGERSLLILGLPLDEARALGVEFEQNAIVWSGPDAVPQLILLR